MTAGEAQGQGKQLAAEAGAHNNYRAAGLRVCGDWQETRRAVAGAYEEALPMGQDGILTICTQSIR